ncbi:nucleolar protein [Nannizzia gypsea CBS 118893]|uniref:Nucleolar protein 16 n=1 Tax=Arthroderma gypseum (strain ATCC MYA-4604 / CBS 118893) TaxID=535722 RepID=E5R1E4_ARTGP|nr:66S preribosome component NOP16 [Nannizzia gypsea CBS 118893]EFQ97695.1 nucleolar protein [Nannizzia gypsea CBS 118893]
MGKVLQKKKNRSSNPKVKHKSKKAKNGNKKINVFGNAVIKSNWDKKLTLTQNYRRLGLTSRLNAPAGGIEKKASKDNDTIRSGPSEAFHVPLTQKRSKKLQPGEVRVERDPETGKILRVISGDNEEDEIVEIAGRKRRRDNPLNDPLEDLPEDTEMALDGLNGTTSAFDVVAELERQAAAQEEQLKNKKPRHQSKREEEWLERLVQKYGDDTARMARDRKLNPMQQTEADIGRRLKKMKARQEQE